MNENIIPSWDTDAGLEACPFCGGKAHAWTNEHTEAVLVGCDFCRVTMWATSLEKAIASWNRRPVDGKLQ